MEEFLPILWSAIGTVLTGLLTWGTTALVNWINSKVKDRKVSNWLSSVTYITSTAVESVMQTYVDALKKSGTFTEECQAEAKQKALDIITKQLTPELKKFIEDNFGDMTTYLSNQIESVIFNIKKYK